MRKFCFVVLSALVTVVGVLSLAGQAARGEEQLKATQVATLIDRLLDRDVPAMQSFQHVTHDLCGVTLGGYCPGRYRSCLRAGRPPAVCQARLEQCETCNHNMLDCRRQVGHQPGYTCVKCRKALDKCRALPAK